MCWGVGEGEARTGGRLFLFELGFLCFRYGAYCIWIWLRFSRNVLNSHFLAVEKRLEAALRDSPLANMENTSMITYICCPLMLLSAAKPIGNQGCSECLLVHKIVKYIHYTVGMCVGLGSLSSTILYS